VLIGSLRAMKASSHPWYSQRAIMTPTGLEKGRYF